MGADVPLTPGRVQYVRERGPKAIAIEETRTRLSHALHEIARVSVITPGAKPKDWLDEAETAINEELNNLKIAVLSQVLAERAAKQ